MHGNNNNGNSRRPWDSSTVSMTFEDRVTKTADLSKTKTNYVSVRDRTIGADGQHNKASTSQVGKRGGAASLRKRSTSKSMSKAIEKPALAA